MCWKDCFRNAWKVSLCPAYMSPHTHPSCGDRKTLPGKILCLVILTVGKSLTQGLHDLFLPSDRPESLCSPPTPPPSPAPPNTHSCPIKTLLYMDTYLIITFIYMVHLSLNHQGEKKFLLHQNADIALLSVLFMEFQNAVRVTAMWEDWDFVHIKEQLVWVFSW